MLEARSFTTRRVIPLPTYPIPRLSKIIPPELICNIIELILADYLTEIFSSPDITPQCDAFLVLLQCNRYCRAIAIRLMTCLLTEFGVPMDTPPGLFLLIRSDDMRRIGHYYDLEEPLPADYEMLEEGIFKYLPLYNIYKVLWVQKTFLRTICGSVDVQFDCRDHRDEFLKLPDIIQEAAAASTDTMKAIFQRGLQSVMDLEHEFIVYRELDRIVTSYTLVIRHCSMLRKIELAYAAGMLSFSQQGNITDAVLNHLTEVVTTPALLPEEEQPVDIDNLQEWAEQFEYSPFELNLALKPHRITAEMVGKIDLTNVVANLPTTLAGISRYCNHSDVAQLADLSGAMDYLEERTHAFGIEEALHEELKYSVLEYWRTGVEPVGYWVPITDRKPPGLLGGWEWPGFAQMFGAAIENK